MIDRQHHALRRELGLFGAVMMGLGAMLGTGVFVSIGIAAGIAGPAVIVAIVIAAAVAMCNALSSAQLAAAHPVSGGTYEYGYRELTPWLGFSAGWMFLCAKTASAATAALGFAGYLNVATGIGAEPSRSAIAIAVVATLTIIVLLGLRRAHWTNLVIVAVTLVALTAFIIAGIPSAWRNRNDELWPLIRSMDDQGTNPLFALLHASALMFVAFTGYGRIATMGEEVREPQRIIPRAIIIAMIIATVLYIAVALVGVSAVGAKALFNSTRESAAPLEVVARKFGSQWVRTIVAIGAMTAMLGVLLNLILGLSRVALAMGRRRDLPATFARLNASQTTPYIAVIVVGVCIGALTLLNDIKMTWSFSAFAVLMYYGITNGAALRLSDTQRRYPRAIAVAGLISCTTLASSVEWQIWLTGIGILAIGLAWHFTTRRRSIAKH